MSFAIVRQLGEGQLGRAYLARDSDDQPVVLKRTPLADAQHEASVLEVLAHDNIIRTHGVVATPPAVVLEYLRGRTLDTLLHMPLDEAIVWAIGVQLGEALAHTHAHGFVHRDVKPENVFAEPDGRIVLADFGVAARIGTPSDRIGDLATGTPLYLSPEQLSAGIPLEAASDVYSLGVILYDALSYSLPYDATDLATLTVAIATHPPIPFSPIIAASERTQALIMRMLSKSPRARPSATEIAVALCPTREPRAIVRDWLTGR